jgi:hypothetical protein
VCEKVVQKSVQYRYAYNYMKVLPRIHPAGSYSNQTPAWPTISSSRCLRKSRMALVSVAYLVEYCVLAGLRFNNITWLYSLSAHSTFVPQCLLEVRREKRANRKCEIGFRRLLLYDGITGSGDPAGQVLYDPD